MSGVAMLRRDFRAGGGGVLRQGRTGPLAAFDAHGGQQEGGQPFPADFPRGGGDQRERGQQEAEIGGQRPPPGLDAVP